MAHDLNAQIPPPPSMHQDHPCCKATQQITGPAVHEPVADGTVSRHRAALCCAVVQRSRGQACGEADAGGLGGGGGAEGLVGRGRVGRGGTLRAPEVAVELAARLQPSACSARKQHGSCQWGRSWWPHTARRRQHVMHASMHKKRPTRNSGGRMNACSACLASAPRSQRLNPPPGGALGRA